MYLDQNLGNVQEDIKKVLTKMRKEIINHTTDKEENNERSRKDTCRGERDNQTQENRTGVCYQS